MKNDLDWIRFTTYVQTLEAWARSRGVQCPHEIVGIVPRLEEKFDRMDEENKRLREAEMLTAFAERTRKGRM